MKLTSTLRSVKQHSRPSVPAFRCLSYLALPVGRVDEDDAVGEVVVRDQDVV